MKKDTLREFIAAQAALKEERESLFERLTRIEAVLGRTNSLSSFNSTPRHWGRASNPMGLRDAVIQVTRLRALTKQEIFEAVKRLGYQFGGKDPLNTLGVILYGKHPRFRNDGGRFSLGPAPSLTTSGRKYTRSAAGRARIAAAQRARWAKARAAKD